MILRNLRNIAIGGLVLLGVVMGVSLIWSWYKPAPLVNPVQFTPAPQIKEVEKIKVVKVPGPTQIVTVEKEKVVEKLKLPDEIAKDPEKQVVATAEVAPYEGETHAVAVMDTQTGQTNVMLKQEKLPLFAFKNEKEFGIRGGYGLDGQKMQLYGRWTFARVGKVHIAAYGEAGSGVTPDAKVMLELSYRW